ncbi:unnamed protein product [Blepharisma stoltei]|uniref:Uncharacterized protein n=1 Tax=Blepharisma stoltei TaxID=1481888 RepID=A0AAU9ISP5_9CILI|nr:unnamed protein product [Blepharisma stoltei]
MKFTRKIKKKLNIYNKKHWIVIFSNKNIKGKPKYFKLLLAFTRSNEKLNVFSYEKEKVYFCDQIIDRLIIRKYL